MLHQMLRLERGMLLERQGIRTFEQWAATQGYPVGGAAGAPAAGGRVIDFGSIR